MERWYRLLSIIAAAVVGLGMGWVVLNDPTAPRWLVALSGIALVIGVAAAVTLLAFAYVVVTEDVRPSIRFRSPVVPLALAHKEAALIGRQRYRHHPVKFWAGLILGSSFFIGWMVFSKPEYLEFKEDREA